MYSIFQSISQKKYKYIQILVLDSTIGTGFISDFSTPGMDLLVWNSEDIRKNTRIKRIKKFVEIYQENRYG
jgi:hypothetical protein